MPKPTPCPIDIPALIADYQSGVSILALSKKYQTHIRRVTRVLKSADIPLRPQGPQPGIWVGKKHSLESRKKMSAIRRALVKPSLSSSYRTRRQAAFCPITGLSEQKWTRWQLQKANYTCQITGQRGIKLAVHHLYDVATHPELRWDEKNIVIVSKALHEAFHYDFMGGSGKPVTPKDWRNFLQAMGVLSVWGWP